MCFLYEYNESIETGTEMAKEILYIGGSPCSGKSTIAARIAQDYSAYYFKVDDYLIEFVMEAANKGFCACKKAASMNSDQTWLRNPEEQCEEEFEIYKEISELVFDKLNSIEADLIITEAAAYTPEVMKSIDYSHYICMVPSPEFQIYHYKQRSWINEILADCTDKEKAFDNWMQRDILFARQVIEQCENDGIFCYVNDGSKNEDEVYDIIKKQLGLE